MYKSLYTSRTRERVERLMILTSEHRAPRRLPGPCRREIVSQSAAMQEALRLAETVAPQATTVVILGETGTGKGLLARHIHDCSPRRSQPFVEVNCAGLQRRSWPSPSCSATSAARSPARPS